MPRPISFSIIMPSYNQASFLEEALQSVIKQNYEHLQFIVLDANSNDGSRKILEKYKDKINILKIEPDSGQADAVNKGFDLADGDVIGWLNSDDFYYPGALQRAGRFFADNPRAEFLFGDADVVDAEGKTLSKWNGSFRDASSLIRYWDGWRPGVNWIIQPSVFFKRELLSKSGPLNTAIELPMDYDLWIRMSGLTNFYYLPQVFAAYRMHKDSKTVTASLAAWSHAMYKVSKAYKSQSGVPGGKFEAQCAKHYLTSLARDIKYGLKGGRPLC